MLLVAVDSIILIANIVFIFIIFICGLFGFLRGTIKSGYFMAITLSILLFSWLLMGPICNKLAYMNIGFLNIEIDGISVESPMQFIQALVENNYSEFSYLFNEDSYSLELIQGTVGFVIKLVYFILVLLGMVTTYYLIFGIAWIFIRKPLRKWLVKDYDPNTKYKIPYTSRFIGLGIGLSKGLLYVFLIGLIFTGIASMAKSVEEIAEGNNEVALVCVNDTFTVVELDSNEQNIESEDALGEYQEVFDLLQAYHRTIPSKIYGSIKYGKNKTSFDEFIFDSVFTIKSKNGKIRVRKELQKISKILTSESVQAVMTDGFDISKLYQLNDEELKEIVDLLSSLDIVKVLVPVGIEFVAYSDMLTNEFGDGFKSIQELIQNRYEELVELDYCNEVKNLGYVFVDVVDLLGEGLSDPSKLDYLSFDQETINAIFDSLSDLELLEIVVPVTINFLLNSDAVKGAIESTGFTIEDLGLNGDIDYVQELMNLPAIYEKLTQLGLKIVDGSIDLSGIDPTKIEGFVEALFDSVIVQNAVPVVATTLVNTYMPEEFSGIFTKEEVAEIDWEKEFAPGLAAAAMLLKSGILEAEDKLAALSNLDDATINDLGKYLSQSELFTVNLNEIIDTLLKTFFSDQITFDGLDEAKGEVWDANEIVALFNVMKQLSNGLTLELTDEQNEELSIALVSSKYIKKNLNNLVRTITAGFDIKVTGLKEEEWTTNEIFSTFKAINIISSATEGNEISIDNLLNLDNEKLNVILESKLIKDLLIDIIVEKSAPGEMLEILKDVYETGYDIYGNKIYDWNDSLVDVDSSVSNGVLTIVRNKQVIQYNIYKNGRYYMSTTDNLVVNLNNVSNDVFTVKGITEKGEIRKIINAFSALGVEVSEGININFKSVVANQDVILDSHVISRTLVGQLIELDTGDNKISVPSDLTNINDEKWYGSNGELVKLLNSLDSLLDISNNEEDIYIEQLQDKLSNLNIKHVIENRDEILKSKVISLTIVNELKKMRGTQIYIPKNLLSYENPWYSEYDQNGQLYKHKELGLFLESLDLIIKDDNANFNNIDVNKLIDDIIKCFESEETAKQLLSSAVMSETIKENLSSNDVLAKYIPVAFDYYGISYSLSSSWYKFDNYGNPEKKELWNLMTGLAILLNGKSIDEIDEFDINDIIENEKMIPVYNSNYEVVSSSIGVVLNSIILEFIFADRVQSMCANGGYLYSVINIPSDVNWYRKDVKANEEYDLQTFLESFILIQKALDFGTISDVTQTGSRLRSLSSEEVNNLATGMVVSRIFKGSIATMFNAIFTVDFALAAQSDKLSQAQKLELASWWMNNKFEQSKFDQANKATARTLFIQKFNAVCDKLN